MIFLLFPLVRPFSKARSSSLFFYVQFQNIFLIRYARNRKKFTQEFSSFLVVLRFTVFMHKRSSLRTNHRHDLYLCDKTGRLSFLIRINLYTKIIRNFLETALRI